MGTEIEPKNERLACDGNIAVAYGVMLCRPDVMSFLPITPQHGMLTQLYQFHCSGLIDAEIVEAEGEQSAMSIVNAASACGSRTFISSSAAGLYFAWDAFKATYSLRLPVVMVNVSREECPPAIVVHSQQDIVGARDQGWIQIYPENCQDCLDMVLMAYRLAEDKEVLLPVIVCMDGFYLSHLTEVVDVPARAEVDRFLAPLQETERVKLTADPVSICGAGFVDQDLAQVRYEYCEAMERAKGKFAEIDGEFAKTFGRNCGGLVQEYRTDDAEVVLVTLGTVTGTARVAVDRKRAEGLKVGLVRVTMLRPLPRERLREALQGKKAVGVIDRNICFGCNCGGLFMDVKSVLYDLDDRPRAVNFIDGIGGLDISVDHLEKAIDIAYRASLDRSVPEVTWLALER